MDYNWTDYHVLTDASTASPVPIRLILSCDLYTTRLAPNNLANFPRINQSHSSIYGDRVGIADAPSRGSIQSPSVRRATPSVSWV
jgi:hypothetical protein